MSRRDNWDIDIHADDYGLTVHTSKDMLDCMRAGKLDSISIVPNMSCFGECMEMLYEAVPSLPFLPEMSVHLDFVEGRCLAGADKVPILAAKEGGLIGLTWGGLFKLSYLPGKRKAAKAQLKMEIRKQIKTVCKVTAKCMEIAMANNVPYRQKGLRIDSHQHAHMIPVAWEALTEVIAEEGYEVEYIRNSREVLGIFLSEVSLWNTYRPINFVKNRVLSFYAHKVDRYAKTHSLKPMYLWGLIMSGRMDYDRVVRLYPKLLAKAQKENRTLEILFHPGLTLPEEVTAEIGEEAAKDFYMRQERHVEKDAVMRLALREPLC